MNKKLNNTLFDDSNCISMFKMSGYVLALCLGFLISTKLYDFLTNDQNNENEKLKSENELSYQENEKPDTILVSSLPVVQDHEKYYVDIPEGYELQEINGEMIAVKIEKENNLSLKLTK